MMGRATFFVIGAAAGVSGSMYARRKAREAAERYAPVKVVQRTAGRVRRRGHDLADAVREGRVAMAAKEAELRDRMAPEPEVQYVLVETTATALPERASSLRR